MLTRRGFAEFASGVICSVAGLMATDASAQMPPPAATPPTTTPPTSTPGITRKTLAQIEGPPGYITILSETEIAPGAFAARHTHPGVESSYILEGTLEIPIDGQPTRRLTAGDSFIVPANTPHAGVKNGDSKTRLVTTYIVEKGKPLASPA